MCSARTPVGLKWAWLFICAWSMHAKQTIHIMLVLYFIILNLPLVSKQHVDFADHLPRQTANFRVNIGLLILLHFVAFHLLLLDYISCAILSAIMNKENCS